MNTTKYKLKKSVEIGGKPYDIRCEYSVILDIFEALNDPDLNDNERACAALIMFYPDFEEIPAENYQEALQQCFRYINGGKEEETTKKQPKMVDWGQDFPYIVSAINRVIGYDVRDVDYDCGSNIGGVSWESFLSAYYEIGGDCLFSQIVRIREKLARNKKLDKGEREWYNKNRNLVDFKKTYSEAESEMLKSLGVK